MEVKVPGVSDWSPLVGCKRNKVVASAESASSRHQLAQERKIGDDWVSWLKGNNFT